MKTSVVLAAVMLAATGAAVAAFNPAARAGEQVCVRFRDLGNLKRIDDSTLLATTRNQGNFIVKLRSPCKDFHQIDNYYKVRIVSQQECFDGDDVLEFRYGGLCFVESVTPEKK